MAKKTQYDNAIKYLFDLIWKHPEINRLAGDFLADCFSRLFFRRKFSSPEQMLSGHFSRRKYIRTVFEKFDIPEIWLVSCSVESKMWLCSESEHRRKKYMTWNWSNSKGWIMTYQVYKYRRVIAGYRTHWTNNWTEFKYFVVTVWKPLWSATLQCIFDVKYFLC